MLEVVIIVYCLAAPVLFMSLDLIFFGDRGWSLSGVSEALGEMNCSLREDIYGIAGALLLYRAQSRVKRRMRWKIFSK